MNVTSLDLFGSELLNFLEDLTALIIVSMNYDTRDEFASDRRRRIEVSDDFSEILWLNLLIKIEFLPEGMFDFSEDMLRVLKIRSKCIFLTQKSRILGFKRIDGLRML